MMTLANNTLPLVGLIFICIAIFYIAIVLRNKSKTYLATEIADGVRMKLAAIFIIASVALFGFYAYIY